MNDRQKLERIIDLISELEPLIQGFDSMYNRLLTSRDKFDEQHKDAYHTLEVMDLNCIDAMKWFKHTKNLERDRRLNKNILELAENVKKVLDDKGRPAIMKQALQNAKVDADKKAEVIGKHALANGKNYMAKVRGVR